MANNDIIRHNDIAEDGVLKPLQAELKETIKILNELDSDLIKIATDLKKALQSEGFGSEDALKKFNNQVTLSNEVLKQSIVVKNETIKTEAAYVVAVSSNTDALDDNRVALEKLKKENKEDAKLRSDQVGAYEKLAIALAKNKREYKDLFIAQKEGTTRAKELKAAIDSMEVSIRSADAQVHQHQRNVGNYGNSFNGLSNSVNQLTREMPAFANSAQTGFMAISNNLPILADAINDLKLKNAALNAEGKKGVPIWQSVAGSLFSWQTAMGVAITVLTVYGKEIGNFFKSLLGLETKTKDQIEAEKKLADARNQAIESTSKQIVSIEGLVKILQTEGYDNQAKIQAYKELQTLIPSLTNLTYEQALSQGVLNESIERELKLIDLRAELQVLNEQVVANKKAELQKKQEQDFQKAYNLEQEKIKLLKFQAAAAKDLSVIFTLADELRIKEIDEELKYLRLSASEKASLVQEQILLLENEGDVQKQNTKNAMDAAKNLSKVKKEVYKDGNKQLLDENDKFAEQLRRQEFEDAKQAYEANQKEFEDTFAQLEKESTLEQEAQWRADEREKQMLVDSQKEKQTILNKTFQLTKSILDKENAMKMKSIEQDIQASQRREDQLRAIAAKGAQSSQENLAFELRKQAELEAKRDKQIKKQIQQERALAILKAFSSGNVTDAKNLSNLIPSFKDGTENTGRVGDPLDADGGRLAILHNEERVFTKEQNKKIGSMSNEAAANILSTFNLLNATSFDKMPMANHVNDDRHINKLDEVASKIDELNNTIKNRPVSRNEFDEVEKLTRHVVTEGLKTTITSKKVGGLYRG
jgi:hypothetical protein